MAAAIYVKTFIYFPLFYENELFRCLAYDTCLKNLSLEKGENSRSLKWLNYEFYNNTTNCLLIYNTVLSKFFKSLERFIYFFIHILYKTSILLYKNSIWLNSTPLSNKPLIKLIAREELILF